MTKAQTGTGTVEAAGWCLACGEGVARIPLRDGDVRPFRGEPLCRACRGRATADGSDPYDNGWEEGR